MLSIHIRELRLIDETLFLAAMQRSTSLHSPWIKAPLNSEGFKNFFARFQQTNTKCFLAFNAQDQLIGVFNLSEIVRGAFQSTYLGFYAVIDYAGAGYMSAALNLEKSVANLDNSVFGSALGSSDENSL